MTRLAVFIFSLCMISACSAMTCEYEGLFGVTRYMQCPGPGDSPDKTFCCGSKENRFCCALPADVKEFVDDVVESLSTNFEDGNKNSDKELNDSSYYVTKYSALKAFKPSGARKGASLFRILPMIIGIIAAVIFGLIILCIVCCCCCPFCIMYKKRNPGRVHEPVVTNAPVDVSAMQPLQGQPPLQAAPISQSPYPMQQQPPYPAQQPYPQSYPVQQPYPPQPYPQQMYPQQQPEQPPPYSEKQPPFNPGYQ